MVPESQARRSGRRREDGKTEFPFPIDFFLPTGTTRLAILVSHQIDSWVCSPRLALWAQSRAPVAEVEGETPRPPPAPPWPLLRLPSTSVPDCALISPF